ncbi:MAG: hypothetical protein HKN08_12295 [Gammaproteobacteria bacterium]|nr:hypothetical protein [Gammaproteobacteria bacterium]
MERHLKERLTGATVLVLLGVTFIPMVLDNSPQQQTSTALEVLPSKPNTEYQSRIIPVEGIAEPEQSPRTNSNIDENDVRVISRPVTVLEEPEQSFNSATTNSPVTTSGSRQESDIPQAVTRIETDNSQALSGWVVQLGSFSNQANAQGLVNDLLTQGYPAFIEELSGDSESIFRVRVGPELERDDAEKIHQSLISKTGIQGIILSYP